MELYGNINLHVYYLRIWFCNTGESRYTSFRYARFYFSIVRCISILSTATARATAQAHCRACSFAHSPHHFDSGIYKLRPLIVHYSNDSSTFSAFPVSGIRGSSQERNSAFNESHLYSYCMSFLIQRNYLCCPLYNVHLCS